MGREGDAVMVMRWIGRARRSEEGVGRKGRGKRHSAIVIILIIIII